MDDDGDALIGALDGDEEEAYEFRMAFSDLESRAETLFNALSDNNFDDLRDYFDDCMVALIGNRYKTIGYDSEEEDYFGLTSYDQDLAFSESGKKLMRKTKQEMISVIGQCVGITLAFYDLRQQYDYLKATMDILRDENTSVLQIIKDIDQAYEDLNTAEFYSWKPEYKRFEALISNLPDRTWIE